MWTLVISCVTLNIVCFSDPLPNVKRHYVTHSECDRALLALARRWHPRGGWKMNCVHQRDA